MAQHNGQNSPSLPHTSISPVPSPRSSSGYNSLFSVNPAGLESDATTPRATPDGKCGATASAQQDQQLPVGKWVQQQKEVAEYQQQEVTHQPQPQPPRQRQRPYPDEMYAPQPAYAIPQYAPQPAYASNYTFPAGVAPGMMYPGMEMGMGPAGVIPPPPPGVYFPQQYTSQYPPYPYAYPQLQHGYPPPAPQTMTYAAPYILPSAPLQSAALPLAPVSQTLVHNGLPTEQREPGTQPFFPSSTQKQTGGIVNSFPPIDAAHSYHPSASEGTQRAEEPAVQPQVPAQMQESMSPAHYAALGQQMAYPNAGFMQQLVSTGSSSAPPSLQKGKGKRRASDDDAVEPEPKRPKQKRLDPSQDPNFKQEGVDKDGNPLWKCQLSQCFKVDPMKVCSVHHHRESNRHLQRKGGFTCQYCGRYSSRKDSLKRHLLTCELKKEQEQNAEMGFAAHGTAEPGPSLMQQQVPTLPLSAGNFSSIAVSQSNAPAPAPRAELSSVPQQALGISPPPVFAKETVMPHVQVSMQASRPEPRPVLQQASGVPPLPVFAQDFPIAPRPVPQQASGIPPLPVFAQELSILPRPVPQQASGVPPPPVVAADFSIDVTEEEEDDTNLFGSPKMTTLALPPAPAVAASDAEDDTDLFGSPKMSTSLALPPAPAVAASAIASNSEDDRDLFGLPEMSTSLALPPVPAVQEGTVIADVPVAGSAPGFDSAALDMSYDDWMNPAVYADPNMDFSSFFNN